MYVEEIVAESNMPLELLNDRANILEQYKIVNMKKTGMFSRLDQNIERKGS